MQAGVLYEIQPDGSVTVNRAIGYRTARMLMQGLAFYRTAQNLQP
jgi:hypothetical protein